MNKNCQEFLFYIEIRFIARRASLTPYVESKTNVVRTSRKPQPNRRFSADFSSEFHRSVW